MFDVRDHIKKLLLLVPAVCVVLAAGVTISGYEVQPVRAKEKSIPEFQHGKRGNREYHFPV